MNAVFADKTSHIWFKSSYSAAHGECVEVATLGGTVAMRDTKNRELGMLSFASKEWQAFLTPTQNNMR